ncbi:hypothetical protein MTBLM5_170058 [Magnetospirillum sp. LM-5]|nr:hypothetical protein MTBLM5_170058 [Magnetospirillum sp. LM-5]
MSWEFESPRSHQIENPAAPGCGVFRVKVGLIALTSPGVVSRSLLRSDIRKHADAGLELSDGSAYAMNPTRMGGLEK